MTTINEYCKSIIDKQTEKGISKYGQTLDSAGLPPVRTIEHAQEELADLLQYLEGLRRKHKNYDKKLLEAFTAYLKSRYEYWCPDRVIDDFIDNRKK